MLTPQTAKIAIIGLGYVGLPLAVEFGRALPTVGYDINDARIADLLAGIDRTLECSSKELSAASKLHFTSKFDELKNCNTYIVTVPTPIDAHKQPDLSALRQASEMISNILSQGDVVIYESTVYPGATEEICVPILEAGSTLKYNRDFYAGYSPERINPGDKHHKLTTITKVTSGSTEKSAEYVDLLYSSIITAGTHKAPSIKVAEAAKVIENTQRDVNIALINELALIFGRIGIDTIDVLEAAETKWNFLPFRPGLVGGHCIGVDPYYLTHKAESIGYHPEIILSGRRINDAMGIHIANQLVKAMLAKEIQVKGSRVLIMGLTFKENCPDLRNTRIVDVVAELEEYGISVDIHDPWVDVEEAKSEYGLTLTKSPAANIYNAIILAVAHTEYLESGVDALRNFGARDHILYDVKSLFPACESDLRL